MTKSPSARQTQKAAADSTRERKFTKINERPTRKDYTCLCKEVQAASTQEYVPYKGADDNGYLAQHPSCVRQKILPAASTYSPPVQKE